MTIWDYYLICLKYIITNGEHEQCLTSENFTLSHTTLTAFLSYVKQNTLYSTVEIVISMISYHGQVITIL